MLIENPDALKRWLSETLTPLCEAEPGTLTQYVLALIKKDKPEVDLFNACKIKLQVFLQDKTRDFVDLLFETLRNKSYLDGNDKPNSAVVRSSNGVISSHNAGDPPHPLQPISDNHVNPIDVYEKPPVQHNRSGSPSYSRDDMANKSPVHRDRERRAGSRHRSPLYRVRDRSPIGGSSPPSSNRDLRDRIGFNRDVERRRPAEEHRRDDDREWDRRPRYTSRYDTYRRGRRSPGRHSPGRRSPGRYSPVRRSPGRRSPYRRRSRSRSPATRFIRSRSNTPVKRHPRSLSGSPPIKIMRARSRTPSRSRSRTPLGNDSSSSRGSTPGLEENELRDKQKAAVHSKATIRCRDYEEKGFCMQGNLCPYDHGRDPVVVDDVPIHSALPFSGLRGAPASGPGLDGPIGAGGASMMAPSGMICPGLPPPEMLRGPPPPLPPPSGPPIHIMRGHAPLQPSMPPSINTHMPPLVPPMRLNDVDTDVYNPEAPGLSSLPKAPYWPGVSTAGGVGSSLPGAPSISLGSTTQPSYIPSKTSAVAPDTTSSEQAEGGGVTTARRPPFTHFRGTGNYRRGNRMVLFKQNTSLEITKIPKEFNNIAKLNEHFGKFGTITNLQVSYNGDPQAALVTFQYPTQATAAYKSTEPIFNNRFIRVFWHNKDDPKNTDNKDEGTTHDKNTSSNSIHNRLGAFPHPSQLALNNKVSAASTTAKTSLTKTVFNTTSTGATTTTSSTASTSLTAVTSQTTRRPSVGALRSGSSGIARKEVIRKQHALLKKKQEMLQAHIKDQKVLISKLDKKTLTGAERSSVLTLIKTLSAKIDKLKEEIRKGTEASSAAAQKHKEQQAAAAAAAGKSKPTAKFGAMTRLTATTASTNVSSLPVGTATSLKEQTKKNILDTELELYAKETSGIDTSELRKRVFDLKQQAYSLGIIQPSARGGKSNHASRGGGRGGGGARGARGGHSSHAVDRRPKSLLVAGFNLQEKDDIIDHLSNFGELSEAIHDETAGTLVVTFHSRQDAEKAMTYGKIYEDKKLSITWQLKVESPDTTSHTVSPLASAGAPVPPHDALTQPLASKGTIVSPSSGSVDSLTVLSNTDDTVQTGKGGRPLERSISSVTSLDDLDDQVEIEIDDEGSTVALITDQPQQPDTTPDDADETNLDDLDEDFLLGEDEDEEIERSWRR